MSSTQLQQLWSYHQLLRAHNPELNLTRIHKFSNMVLKLYADSMMPGQLIELPSPLLDLGSGPGMPGIPLKIAYPHLQVHLAESRQKRAAFLETARERLKLDNLFVIGKIITAGFEQPMAGMISRAVESIEETLDRLRGCLLQEGTAIFMKGPHCDHEIEAAVKRFADTYRLIRNISYRIPQTPHQRRLVVFQRIDQPLFAVRAKAMKRHSVKSIESEQNAIFKNLRKLLSARGIRKQERAILSGGKIVNEALRDFPE
ncbi:MAG: 16S rRNA (guanine(527)-N(7))-methyltransferase RsmG, partial [Desulforhabdus sp.]|nr:16S rRNA (guanine(527)-N(7))-methyltransferase RsmG [Desulforhabdus sp.]